MMNTSRDWTHDLQIRGLTLSPTTLPKSTFGLSCLHCLESGLFIRCMPLWGLHPMNETLVLRCTVCHGGSTACGRRKQVMTRSTMQLEQNKNKSRSYDWAKCPMNTFLHYFLCQNDTESIITSENKDSFFKLHSRQKNIKQLHYFSADEREYFW